MNAATDRRVCFIVEDENGVNYLMGDKRRRLHSSPVVMVQLLEQVRVQKPNIEFKMLKHVYWVMMDILTEVPIRCIERAFARAFFVLSPHVKSHVL